MEPGKEAKDAPQMSVTGILYLCKGICESWVGLLLWEELSCFCFYLRACFIPPPSAGESNLSQGIGTLFFKLVLLILSEGLCEQTAR